MIQTRHSADPETTLFHLAYDANIIVAEAVCTVAMLEMGKGLSICI